MPENIPYKRTEQDKPVPGLTAEKAIDQAIEAADGRQKITGRRHFGRGESRNPSPEERNQATFHDYQRFEERGED